MTQRATTDEVADRVVVRYAPVTDRVSDELSSSRYSAYLGRAEAGPVAVGDEWEHFVSCGCGSTQDVRLTVESVEGGDRIGTETAFAFLPGADDADG